MSAPDGSKLCLSCGICCTGAFFLKVEVNAEEARRVSNAGISVEQEGERLVFHLPCSANENKTCQIYNERPGICRQFTCKSLDEYLAGTLKLEEALERTGIMVSSYEKALEMVNGDVRFLWKLIHTKVGNPEFQELLGPERISEELAELVAALRASIQGDFRKLKKEL